VAEDVTDTDRGMKGLQARLVDAHGMQGRVGIHSGKPRYPQHGRTQVARVAGVHHVERILGSELDAMNAQINAAIAHINDMVVAGMRPEQAILEAIEPYRDAIRARIRAELHVSGLLERNIGAAVYQGGGRKWLAGDPKDGVA
jgi:hypothetical protein